LRPSRVIERQDRRLQIRTGRTAAPRMIGIAPDLYWQRHLVRNEHARRVTIERRRSGVIAGAARHDAGRLFDGNNA